MSAQVEMWRVSTPEGVFEADLETLKQWISEGAVLPTDKVSKGSLNWIEAGRAPMLRSAFNPDAPAPVSSNTQPFEELRESPDNTTARAVPPPTLPHVEDDFPSPAETAHRSTSARAVTSAGARSNACQNHPQLGAYYICRVCAATFCETCPRIVNKIPLCPSCGDLCKLFHEERHKAARQQFQGSGFGFADFGRALKYPLQHKVALLCGAALYGFLLLAGFRGQVVAYVIMFGCISHVISQVAWGRLDRSFMPDLSAFSMWDDVAVPIGLGIGITIVTWGPVIVLILALFFGVVGGARNLASNLPDHSSERSALTEEDLSVLTDPEADPKKLEEANNKLNQTRPANVITREAEKSKHEQSDPFAAFSMLLPYLGAGIVVVLLLLVALAWAIFYYPMALAVAGYTQSFGSVVNPLVGLDTIKRMGGNYFKAFGMVLLLQVVAVIVGIVVAIITSPFALPLVGNLPAKFIDGSLTFYFNLVIACVLGLSLYKCADRLGISVD